MEVATAERFSVKMIELSAYRQNLGMIVNQINIGQDIDSLCIMQNKPTRKLPTKMIQVRDDQRA